MSDLLVGTHTFGKFPVCIFNMLTQKTVPILRLPVTCGWKFHPGLNIECHSLNYFG